MDKFDIQKLRDLPIEGVAERLGLRVQRHKALCPFHQDSHPSLTFNVSKNTFKCYVCNAYGGTIDLAMKLLPSTRRMGEGLFTEACHWLANEHNVILTEWQPANKSSPPSYQPSLDLEWLECMVARPHLSPQAQMFLFDERRIDPRVVRWLGISSIEKPAPCWRYGKPYYDAPSLLIPYRDIDGRLLSVQSRYLGPPSVKEGVPRFRFPRGGKCGIYNLPILRMLKPGEPLYISEGVTDCMALLSAGHKAIAIPSATLLKPADIEIITRPIRDGWRGSFHMYPDADAPGEKLYQELVSMANQLQTCLIRHSLPIGCKDFGEYWKNLNNHQSVTVTRNQQ